MIDPVGEGEERVSSGTRGLFSIEEYEARLRAVRTHMAARGVDVLLVEITRLERELFER